MNVVIELDSDLLVERSKQIWAELSKMPLEYQNGLALIEDAPLQSVDIPWISGEVRGIVMTPGCSCPIHCDYHKYDLIYNRSLNIIIDSDGNNHSTRYYKCTEGEWNPTDTPGLYTGDYNDLTKVFEYTLTKPTIFYNQILHDVYNYGNKNRILIMWLIEKTVSEDDILNWCNKNNIKYNTIYEV